MKITKIEIQKKNKNRYNIFLDNDFWMGVDEDVIIKFSLNKDKQIDSALKNEIEAYENVSKVYNATLNYLSFSLRSKKEIIMYVQNKLDKEDPKFEEYQAIVINKLENLGLINDLIYAQSYVRTSALINKKGITTIKYDLINKGIDEEIIATALAEYPLEQQNDNMLTLARKFCKNKEKIPQKTLENKLKVHLSQKGYPADLIQTIELNQIVEFDSELQDQWLDTQALKVINNKQRKFQGFELKQRVIQGLISKGFEYDSVLSWCEKNKSIFEEE